MWMDSYLIACCPGDTPGSRLPLAADVFPQLITYFPMGVFLPSPSLLFSTVFLILPQSLSFSDKLLFCISIALQDILCYNYRSEERTPEAKFLCFPLYSGRIPKKGRSRTPV